MLKRFLNNTPLIALILCSFHPAISQNEQAYVVSTNRPNQTDAIGIMAPGYIQFESGIGYLGISNDLFESDIIFLPSLQLRFGIIEKLEINFFYDYNNLHFTSAAIDNILNDHFLTIGSKYHLWNENGAIPEAIGVFNLHYTNAEGLPDDWDWEVRFIFQNNISDRFALAYMLRFRENLAFAINPSYSINEQWSAFFEYFSDISLFGSTNSENGINLGLGYLVNERVTLDVMYGTVFNQGFSTNLLTTGVGWWIK